MHDFVKKIYKQVGKYTKYEVYIHVYDLFNSYIYVPQHLNDRLYAFKCFSGSVSSEDLSDKLRTLYLSIFTVINNIYETRLLKSYSSTFTVINDIYETILLNTFEFWIQSNKTT